MKIKEVNWYGIRHKKVLKHFSGGLTYIRSFEIAGSVWAVYKVANPNKKLGHKKYLMLGVDGSKQMFVSGRSAQAMTHLRRQHAVHCLQCDTVLYSINTHHAHSCDCPNRVMIDGGRDYIHTSCKNPKKVRYVDLDLITGEVIDRPKSKK